VILRQRWWFGLSVVGAFALGGGRAWDHGEPLSHAFAADPEPAGTFDPDIVRAIPGSARKAVIDARVAGDLAAARAAALDGVLAEPAEAPLLRFMAAQASHELGMAAEALELLLPVAESEHPLAPWARLDAGEWLESEDPARGLALIEPVLNGSPEAESFPGVEAARRLRGRLLARLGRTEEAIAQLELLLDAASDESLSIQVTMPLAELLAARADEASRVRALSLVRRVAHRVPATRVGRKAEQLASEWLAALSPELRESLKQPSYEDRLAKADALLADARFADAERAYTALASDPSEQAALLCRARFGRAKALLDRRSRAEGAAQMGAVAEECAGDIDQRAWARYHAARAFSALAQNDLSLHHYDALQQEAPEHRLADDALFRASKVLREMGDVAGARARLQALPQRFPNGDMRARALFALAWQSHTEGDVAEAARLLEGADVELEDAEDLHGRAPYWRARFLSELGQKVEAADAFAALFLRTPLSYYGQQAFARLETLDAARATKLAEELAVAQNTPLVFAAEAALDQPGFFRAVSLLQIGDTARGMMELRALGFLAPEGDVERYWLSVALLDRAGAHPLSVELARKRVFDLLRRAPKGRDLAFYRLAYPPAFAPLIEEASDREHVPSAFVRAVAREESAFNPRAVSRAQAYGLIQIIQPTARAIARGLDLPHDPESLRRPDINLALGVRFIGTLASGFGGQFALVPAAYNAGPGATQRWLTERASEPLDVWIENVPYDETRHYTRRVLQSYGIYAWLDSGRMLSLPAAL